MVDEALPGPGNMARDHALLRSLGTDEATLRIYRWKYPTVSFGRHERVRGRYDRELAAQRGIGFVRRPTGGKAVYHDRELTYSVVFPLARRWGIRHIYKEINRAFLEALLSLGVPAIAAQLVQEYSPGRSLDFCFQDYMEGELIVEGKKLVGSAQVRERGSILQHGSLLIGQGQECLQALCIAGGYDMTVPGPTSLVEIMEREPSWEDLVLAVMEGFRSVFGGDWSEEGLRENEQEAEAHFLKRYASDEWTWRK